MFDSKIAVVVAAAVTMVADTAAVAVVVVVGFVAFVEDKHGKPEIQPPKMQHLEVVEAKEVRWDCQYLAAAAVLESFVALEAG